MVSLSSHVYGRTCRVLITAAASSAFLLFGYDQGVMGGLLTGPQWVAQFPRINTNAGANGSAALQGTVVAIYEVGCLFGSLSTFFFAERLGRRWTIATGCVVLCVGAALQTAASGLGVLIAGRIVAGLGNGINTSTVPVWHGECTPAASRGRAIATELAINTFGTMTAYWVDYGMSYTNSQASFRVPLSLQMVFAVTCLVLLPFCPESPRYLVRKGDTQGARQVLRQLSLQTTHEGRDDDANLELAQIQAALAEEAELSGQVETGKRGQMSPLRACFTNGKERYFHRVLLGFGSQFMQQLCGINLIAYYAPVIFEQSVGLDRNTSLLLSGFDNVVNWGSSVPAIYTIERFGRRPLMMFSCVGQCIAMALLAGGTRQIGARGPGIVATVGIFLFSFFFASGLLSVPWLYPTEIAPLPIRSASAAIGSASNWIWNFLVVEITPVSIKSIGYGTYIYFCAFNAAFVPLIYFCYPETQGLVLEEVDLLFTGPKVLLHLPQELRMRNREAAIVRDEIVSSTEGDNTKSNVPLALQERIEHV